MCFSSPSPPAPPPPPPLPDPNDDERDRAAKDAALAAKRRRGFGNTDLSRSKLGSNTRAQAQRPTLLGQGAQGAGI